MMAAAFLPRAKYPLTLLDRLADGESRQVTEKFPLRLITAEQVKESVAHDLESLLNCRCAFNDNAFQRYPESFHSMCSYGMNDFVGRSLANPADRTYICRSLERTIAVHEKRLQQIRVSLEMENGSVNRLKFAIHALLIMHPATEPVFFDALLQPSTLQYTVCSGRRSGAA